MEAMEYMVPVASRKSRYRKVSSATHRWELEKAEKDQVRLVLDASGAETTCVC